MITLSTSPISKPACVDKKPGSICSACRGAFRIAHLIEPSQANAGRGDDNIPAATEVTILFIYAPPDSIQPRTQQNYCQAKPPLADLQPQLKCDSLNPRHRRVRLS